MLSFMLLRLFLKNLFYCCRIWSLLSFEVTSSSFSFVRSKSCNFCFTTSIADYMYRYGLFVGSWKCSGDALSVSVYLFARLLAASFLLNSDFSIDGLLITDFAWVIFIGLCWSGLKAPRFLDWGDSKPWGNLLIFLDCSGVIGFKTFVALWCLPLLRYPILLSKLLWGEEMLMASSRTSSTSFEILDHFSIGIFPSPYGFKFLGDIFGLYICGNSCYSCCTSACGSREVFWLLLWRELTI